MNAVETLALKERHKNITRLLLYVAPLVLSKIIGFTPNAMMCRTFGAD